LSTRLRRVIETHGARTYEIPKDTENYSKRITELREQETNLIKVRTETEETIKKELDVFSLAGLSGNSKIDSFSMIEELKILFFKEKSIYENMDKLIIKDQILHGTFWCTKFNADNVKRIISEMPESAGRRVQKAVIEDKDYHGIRPKLTPPSYFRTNDFTQPFQDIVETYGIPRYREVNPSIWTVITFPYQFGVMFGDIGHGGLLFLVGICLCLFNDSMQKKSAGLDAVLKHRYLLFLMGGFAFFCGICYNDFFAVP